MVYNGYNHYNGFTPLKLLPKSPCRDRRNARRSASRAAIRANAREEQSEAHKERLASRSQKNADHARAADIEQRRDSPSTEPAAVEQRWIDVCNNRLIVDESVRGVGRGSGTVG